MPASIPVQRLPESARDALREHLLAFGPEDLYLRFGTAMQPEAIAAYVERIDFDNDVVFGVHDDALRLIGAAHLAFGDTAAEFGVSVLPGHRGRGIGSSLFARAAEHARNRYHRRLYMHCLSRNAAMMRIARRAEMDVIVETGEADAYLDLPAADPMSITHETVVNRLAVIDYELKAQVETMRRVARALETPPAGGQ